MTETVIKQIASVMRDSLINGTEISTVQALTIVRDNANSYYKQYIWVHFNELVEQFNEKLEMMTQSEYNKFKTFKPKKPKTSLEKEIYAIETMGYRE